MNAADSGNRKTIGKKYVKIMGNVVCALSILFVLAAFLRTDFSAITVKDWRIFLPVCAAGILLKTVTVFLSGSAWCLWLEFFAGKKCDRKEALRVYAKANIGKYLPGNVMHYVERNLFAGKLELSQKQIAAASVVEVAGLVFTAFSLSACMAYSSLKEAVFAVFAKLIPEKQPDDIWLGVGIVFAVIIGMLVLAAVGFFYYLWKKRAGKTFLYCYVIYASVLSILGVILVIVYWCMAGNVTLSQALVMVAAYMIAWVLGFVVPGAPGGIGVREMVLTMMLAPVIGQDMIVTLSVLHRLITVIGDFAAYVVRP